MLTTMRINFDASFRDLFSTEKKWMTILLLTVCNLIPLVGPFVTYGYLVRRFSRERIGKQAEDFDFDHFVEHLMIGIWPILAGLVIMLVLSPLFIVAVLPMMIGPMTGTEDVSIYVGSIVATIAITFFLLFVMGLLCCPIQLRSGFKMDFAAGFSSKFAFAFLRKVGLSLCGWMLLLNLIFTPLFVLGSLAFSIGYYPVMTFFFFSWTHLLFQHYDLYLERGGEPVEFADELVRDFRSPPLLKRTSPPPLPGG